MAVIGTLVSGLAIGLIIFSVSCCLRKAFPRFYAYKCFENTEWAPEFDNSKINQKLFHHNSIPFWFGKKKKFEFNYFLWISFFSNFRWFWGFFFDFIQSFDPIQKIKISMIFKWLFLEICLFFASLFFSYFFAAKLKIQFQCKSTSN